MCTNSFFPKITLPTRCASRSCTLIDNMFCKVPQKDNLKNAVSSAVLLSRISDHFPCVVNFQNLEMCPLRPKYILKRSTTESHVNAFREDLLEINIPSHLNANLACDQTLIMKNSKVLSLSHMTNIFLKNELNLINTSIRYLHGLPLEF